MSAGIGTAPCSIGSATTGNIVFNSGIVIAKGDGPGAGIGGSEHVNASNITINGGTVIATGGSDGAGIGSGGEGNTSGITINDGTVTATSNGDGAGIGSGSRESNGFTVSNIRITGGTVTATSNGNGAGIGGGYRSIADNIVISGGTVTATSKKEGCGIGSGLLTETEAASDEVADQLDSNSGTNIMISGGKVLATGKVGIGKQSVENAGGSVGIIISGGTITASGSNKDIGGSDEKNTSVTITGGSIKCSSVAGNAKDQAGNTVSKTTVALQGATEGLHIVDLSVTNAKPSYGTKDLYTLDTDKLYLWLPSGCAAVDAQDDQEDRFCGNVEAGTSGTLAQGANLTLLANGGTSDGSAFATYLSTSLTIIEEPGPKKGCWIVGYAIYQLNSGEWEMITNSAGEFIANKFDEENHPLTDSYGRWIYQGDSLELYTVWREPYYFIDYDPNAPQTASTTPTGIDTMPEEMAYASQQVSLRPCTFELPGYTFDGWNTKPDGTGTSYNDQQTVKGLSTIDGDTVTLYAQWKPIEYSIVLTVGGKGQYQQKQVEQTKFDEAVVLEWKDAIPDNERILGWSSYGLGSFYADGSTVVNLCGLNSDGTLANQEVSLSAVTVEEGVAYVTITNDGRGVALDRSDITLTGKEGTVFRPFIRDIGGGIYATDSSAALPDGTYTVSVDGWDTRDATIEIAGGFGILSLEYFTVSVKTDDQTSAWIGKEGQTSVEKCMAGDEIEIGASATAGYSFKTWTVAGIPPSVWDATDAQQTVKINGPVTFIAYASPSTYQIAFDPNGGEGSMGDQSMTYGKTRTLSANLFTRDGYNFAGWTLTPEWTGTEYADCAKVQNLTDEQNGTVTLYAQWTPWSYFVEFNPNGADPGEVMQEQEFLYDTPQELLACTYTLKNHHFVGWNTEADGSGYTYADQQEIANLVSERNELVTLYAQWEHDTYTVEYDANGGTGKMENQVIPTGAGNWLASCKFERNGYAFAGWNTQADGSGTTYQPDTALDKDLAASDESVTLYAQWNANHYQVAFDPNGGSGEMQAQSMVYDESQKLSSCGFTREGYSFTGWNTEPDGSGTSYADGQKAMNLTSEANGTVTLYAQWEENPQPDPDPDNPIDPNSEDTNSEDHPSSKLVNTGDPISGTAGVLMLVVFCTLTIALIARRLDDKR